MKYFILVGDGMGDYPVEELAGRTPLEAARTPWMDHIASGGELGIYRSIPEGFEPGSDVANLVIMGYDPAKYYPGGRGPLEAASMGVELAEDDVAFRCNLVFLGEKGGKRTFEDYSAGHISTDEARRLINAINAELGSTDIRFYPGISYRHLLVWKGKGEKTRAKPPHDIPAGSFINRFMPEGPGSDELAAMIKKSWEVLDSHPINKKRREKGLAPANSIWPWGQGKKPKLPTFQERFGISGAIISAVDLVKGIGILAGMESLDVPGATGYIDTNYEGKALYALEALKKHDLVYVHVEAPDEMGHEGNAEKKIEAIEMFDSRVVGTICQKIPAHLEYGILLLTDHMTPITARTHTPEPVPFAIFRGNGAFEPEGTVKRRFIERDAAATGLLVDPGHLLIERLIQKP